MEQRQLQVTWVQIKPVENAEKNMQYLATVKYIFLKFEFVLCSICPAKNANLVLFATNIEKWFKFLLFI